MVRSRKVIVSGSAGGIGSAIVARLRADGDTVVGIDCKDADIVAELATPMGRKLAISAATDWCSGSADAVITCAGVAGGTDTAVIEVNYFGTVDLFEGLRCLLEQSPAPRALAISSAAILNEVSKHAVDACLAGDRAGAVAAVSGNPQLAYSTSKFAVSQWVRRMAGRSEWAGQGILLNALAPGTILTPMTRPILETPEGRAMLRELTPIVVNDFAKPEDLAPFAAFLAGPDNRYTVGQTLFCDGGTELLRREENRF